MPAGRSVRTRLLLMVTAVVLVAVAAVGWTSRRVTRSEFGLLVNRLQTEIGQDAAAVLGAELESLGNALQESFLSRGDWSGAGDVFGDSAPLLDGRTALLVVGNRVLASNDAGLRDAAVKDLGGGGIEISGWERTYDSAGGRVVMTDAQAIAFRGPSHAIHDSDGGEAGVLHLLPSIPGRGVPHIIEADDREAFLWSVDRWILGAVLGVGLLAMLAAVVLSGRIVRPIEELTEASRRMGAGDLGHRVEVRSADEIGELASAFNSMAASLEHQEHLRRNMVTDVAHELRTPLTNLRGQLEAVQDGLISPTPGLIASLHEEAMLLNHLVEDLQELALAEAGQLRLKPEAIDVGGEIERAVELFRAPRHTDDGAGAETGDAHRQIRMDVDEGLPPAIADLQRFRQVLRNLLKNALEHGGGGVVVTARGVDSPPASGLRPAHVTDRDAADPFDAADVAGDSGYVAVTVADSGPGIDPDQLANVFERFYRTDPSRQRATGGAGLGLAIVRQLVEAQGGRVWVESEPGEGALFGFCLPAEESRDLA